MSHVPHIKTTLSPNDQQQFKSLVKQYEKKELKKAIKTADAILKKYPNHGETLAMKALVVNSMDKRKKDAYQLARKAIRYDLTSAMTWHVLAILYRSDRCYFEALRCMQSALQFNSTDRQLLRELAGIQVQVRDFAGLLQTRKQILEAESKLETNWLSYAVAAHLKGQHKSAVTIIDNFEELRDKHRIDEAQKKAAAAQSAGKAVPDPADLEKLDPYEQSELLLYKNLVIQEGGDLKGALENLNAIKSKVVDLLSWREARASLLVKLGQWTEAEAVYRELISINHDQRDYHVGLQRCVLQSVDTKFSAEKSDLTVAEAEKLLALYAELRSQYPKAALVNIYPLFIYPESQIDKFRAAFAEHARTQLEKGIPSFWNSIKPLYRNAAKTATVESLMLGALETLRSPAKKFLATDAKEQPPSTELWLLLFLAQHFNRLNQHKRALELIDEAIAHTPTCLDAYLFKARILKHAGAPGQAAELVNKTREMDLADRYLNNKSTLYLLRAGKIEEAQKLINIFTKIEADTYNNIFEMQVSWYEQAEGEAWLAKGEFGRALKRFTDIEKHFEEFIEDQVDFHTYNIRKSTIRAYIDLVRFEDRIHGHSHFVSAAQSIVETYLRVIDQPSKAEMEDLETAGMSEEDKKAYLAKKKRQAARERARAANQTDANGPKNYKKCYGGRYDWDLDGERLLKVANPLQKCTKYVQTLQQFAPNSLRTQLLSADVYLRREKVLLALKAIKRAASLSAQGIKTPGVHAALVKFLNLIQSKTASVNATVKQVVDLELAELIGAGAVPSAAEYNQKYLAAEGEQNFEARFNAIKVAITTLGQKTDAMKASLLDLSKVTGYPLGALLEAYRFIQSQWPKADADSFKDAVHAKYPLIEAFAPAVVAAATAEAAEGEDPSAAPKYN